MTTLRHLRGIKVTEVMKMMERIQIVTPKKSNQLDSSAANPTQLTVKRSNKDVETEIIFVITLLLHCYSLQPNDIKVMVLFNPMFVKIISDGSTFKVYTNDENSNNP